MVKAVFIIALLVVGIIDFAFIAIFIYFTTGSRARPPYPQHLHKIHSSSPGLSGVDIDELGDLVMVQRPSRIVQRFSPPRYMVLQGLPLTISESLIEMVVGRVCFYEEATDDQA